MSKKKESKGFSNPFKVASDPRVYERTMRDLQEILKSQHFDSMDEAQAFMHQYLKDTGGVIPARVPDTPRLQAEEMVYNALEKRGKKRADLLKKALEIDEDCAEAYVLLAEDVKTDEEAKPLYERAVLAAERTLGPDFLADEENVGHYWGIFETRPYMRARGGLGVTLWELGEQEQAITHFIDLLRLNPNDNMGIRYALAVWLFVSDRLDEAKDLIDRYEVDSNLTFMYIEAFIAFANHGSGWQADSLLRDAFKANPLLIVMFLEKVFGESLVDVNELTVPKERIEMLLDEAQDTILDLVEILGSRNDLLRWVLDCFAELQSDLDVKHLPNTII